MEGFTDFIVAGPAGSVTAGPAGHFMAAEAGHVTPGKAGHVPIDTTPARVPIDTGGHVTIDTSPARIPYAANTGPAPVSGSGIAPDPNRNVGGGTGAPNTGGIINVSDSGSRGDGCTTTNVGAAPTGSTIVNESSGSVFNFDNTTYYMTINFMGAPERTGGDVMVANA